MVSFFKLCDFLYRGDIFRIENPSVFLFFKFFLLEIWVDYVQKVCKKIVYCCLNIP
jgi:hypothetical protein